MRISHFLNDRSSLQVRAVLPVERFNDIFVEKKESFWFSERRFVPIGV